MSSLIVSLFSKINIVSPSEILSPTLTLTNLIFPSKEAGISTLDLSLSIVISGSFFDTDYSRPTPQLLPRF
tara:strand:+ start:1879 stop:2091 length:213 start_codon:yes stop_codon:yes gene_type:complete